MSLKISHGIDFLLTIRVQTRKNILMLSDVKNEQWARDQLIEYGRALRAVDNLLLYLNIDPDEAESLYAES